MHNLNLDNVLSLLTIIVITTLKRKFLDGLPDDLVENLFKARRVSAEHTPIHQLLREVKAMESAIQAYQNY